VGVASQVTQVEAQLGEIDYPAILWAPPGHHLRAMNASEMGDPPDSGAMGEGPLDMSLAQRLRCKIPGYVPRYILVGTYVVK